MRASTINAGNIALYPQRRPAAPWATPRNVNVLGDPRASIYYDAVNNRAIIDLNGLDQTELPSGHYYLAVNDNGHRRGGQPPRRRVHRPVSPRATASAGGTFLDDLGNVTLSPPIVASLSITPASDTGLPGDQNTARPAPCLRRGGPQPVPRHRRQPPGRDPVQRPEGQLQRPRRRPGGARVRRDARPASSPPTPTATSPSRPPSTCPTACNRCAVVVVGQTDLPVQAGPLVAVRRLLPHRHQQPRRSSPRPPPAARPSRRSPASR